MSAGKPFENEERSMAGESLVRIVSCVLEELVNSSAQAHLEGALAPTSKFHGLRAPTIAIGDYLLRISKFSGCSDECFVLALIYIDRLISKRKIVLDALNVHRLICTSVMLAAKFFDDMYLDNHHYAAVGGVPKTEMNILELEFLFLLEFNLFVTTADYDMYRSALLAKVESAAVAQTAMHPLQQPQQPWTGRPQPYAATGS